MSTHEQRIAILVEWCKAWGQPPYYNPNPPMVFRHWAFTLHLANTTDRAAARRKSDQLFNLRDHVRLRSR